MSPQTYLLLRDALLLLTMTLAVITDLRARRIYDWITLPALALGLLLAFSVGGFGDGWSSGLKGAALGTLFCGGVFVVLALAGATWGGDVKLMAAAGALFGYPQAIGALLFVSVAGGVQGVLMLIARQPPLRRLLRGLGVESADDPEFGKTVPYGLAIAAGTLGFRLWLGWPPGSPS